MCTLQTYSSSYKIVFVKWKHFHVNIYNNNVKIIIAFSYICTNSNVLNLYSFRITYSDTTSGLV